MKYPQAKGFTLLEILIALAIFAILAVMTSSAMYNAFNTRSRINEQADRLNDIQLGMSLIKRDIQQIIERPVRGDQMILIPALVGQSNYLEITRDGIVNPLSAEKRSTLKRIALVCAKNSLIRRTWLRLDNPKRKIFEEKVLLANLNKCQFSYLNHNLQNFSEWRESLKDQGKNREPFPKAIQLDLTLDDWGNMKLLFIVPEALYVKT